MHSVSHYVPFFFPLPFFSFIALLFLSKSQKGTDEWRLTVKEVIDENTRREQKAILLNQLELILTDEGRREDS